MSKSSSKTDVLHNTRISEHNSWVRIHSSDNVMQFDVSRFNYTNFFPSVFGLKTKYSNKMTLMDEWLVELFKA